MNIALESTREFFNNKQVNSYGDVFIRGNNGESFPSIHAFYYCY